MRFMIEIVAAMSVLLWQACAPVPGAMPEQANGSGGAVTPAPPPTPTAQNEDRGAEPATQPASEPPAAASPASAEALLERLERAAADLRAFTAQIEYDAWDDLIGRSERRTGELVYATDEQHGKRFAVLFDRIERNNRREERLKHYVFDGQWLAEIDHANRQFIKRQIVAPGERLDPLKLGEGPFPLPVGQPAAQVLERFEASLLEPPAEGPLASVRGRYEQLEGLRLVPRPGTREASDYARIDLLYDARTLLPVGIHLVETNGDTRTVRLRDVQRNPELDEETRAKLSIEEPDRSSWAVSVVPWEG